MKEFSVTVQVRNNRLKERREALGLNQRQLCDRAGVSQNSYAQLEKLKLSPMYKTGAWRTISLFLATFFDVKPDELFPHAVLLAKESRKEIKADGEELMQLTDSLRRYAIDLGAATDPELLYQRTEIARMLDKWMEKLSPRQEQMVRLAFGMDGQALTSVEIAKEWELSPSRIRQIVNKAVRRLRRHAADIDVDA